MIRKIVQILTAIVTNSYISGFINGTIYQGKLKNICVPGLNCYSCPGSLGSCPIGSLQAVMGSVKYRISYYVTGLIILFGGFLGRWICGWICPFGLMQELLYKIPGKKISLAGKRKWLSWIRYPVLIIFVIGIPLLVVNIAGYGSPAFCKYICPAGTIEAALPLILADSGQFGTLGALFVLKASIAAVVVIASVFIYRPFCTVLCPLGLIYGWMNKVSLYQMHVDEDKCIKCGKCAVACKLDIEIYKNPTSMECIRCGECKPVCPTEAITSGIRFRSKAEVIDTKEGN